MRLQLVPDEARRHIAPYLIFTVAAALARAASALLLVPLLGALFTAGAGATLPWLAALAVAVALGWLAETRLILRAFDLGFAVANRMNHRLIDQFLAVPIGEFGAKQQSEAKRAVSGSVSELFAAFVNLGGQVGISLLLPMLIGIGLLFVAWPLGVVTLIAAPILLAALLSGARLLRKAETAFAAAAEDVTERTDEFAKAQLVLRAAGRAGLDGTPLGEAIDRQRRTGLRLLGLTIPGTLTFTIAFQAVLIALVAVIAYLFAAGTADAVMAVALIVVITRYLEAFRTLSDLFPALETVRGAWRRTADSFALPVLARAEADAAPRHPAVKFRNVGFAPGGHQVLNGISFAVPQGTTTAIVGPSGSGKSTILSLVARFHEASSGEVLVSGHDVRAYLPQTLMAELAIVFQNVQLFEGGISDNIRIARPAATDEELREAMRAARADEIVERLGDRNAPVGEGGSSLSGGERQRVSIARALLKGAPILLLDEATSSLDAGNEAAIATAIRSFAGRTVLIVAHRIETIAHADNIVFVENGRVVEEGPRERLIRQGGRFAAYWAHRRAALEWRL
jgi:ATP-binding cassette subfamily B protein IrtB